MTTTHVTVPTGIRSYFDASNAHDADAVLATMVDDAIVNDDRREFAGADAIRSWLEREIFGVNVTKTIVDAREHHGTVIVRAAIEGDFDKTGLPDPLVMTFYFVLLGGLIAEVFVILNKEVA
jgi:ketosteroid isomerase-like protein